jgi:hypothetical protein
MMAAQYESEVIVWRKAIVRCIGLIISRFDSESQPRTRSPAGPGRHVYDLPLAHCWYPSTRPRPGRPRIYRSAASPLVEKGHETQRVGPRQRGENSVTLKRVSEVRSIRSARKTLEQRRLGVHMHGPSWP